MKPDISEFSYGYCVTEELVKTHKSRWAGAPVFPSLVEEGRSGGYDVMLRGATPLFLQFKLCDYLQKRTAKEYKLIKDPYFRMALRPKRHSKQHGLLIKLEKKFKNQVFYIAPAFHLTEELDNHYNYGDIIRNSAVFSPKEIGPLPDDQDHCVVFSKTSTIAFRCSEQHKEIKRLKFVSLDRPPHRNSASYEKVQLDVGDLYQKLLSLLGLNESSRSDFSSHSLAKPTLEAVGNLARMYFSCELFIVSNIVAEQYGL